jgi:peptidoglycan hydrolase-like protein with peptidoglycan-binding domain
MDKKYVKWLQYYLVKYGYLAASYVSGGKEHDNIDGSFGARTEEAVRQFQLKHSETYSGAVPDCCVGAKTRKALTGGAGE